MLPFLIPVLTTVVSKVVDGLIANPSVPVTQAEAVVVARQVEKTVAPIIEHLTNNEPWYQSRVTWGAIGAIFGGAATIITLLANGETDMNSYVPAAASLFGGVTTLWGRWRARKPLGT